jgi:hypothetical protein
MQEPEIRTPDDANRPWRLPFRTAREWAQDIPDQTDWIVEPFVAAGNITKIDGTPKLAGKTTFILHMIASVLDGRTFAGYPTKTGAVVLISEQDGPSLREALDRANLCERDDLYVLTYRDLASVSWAETVGQVFAFAEAKGAVLVAIDTLPACARIRGDDENSAGRAQAVLEPIKVGAAETGIGVVMSFHDRKSGGEVVTSGRGSSAFAGAVDIILQLQWLGGNQRRTVRKIEAASRFTATPGELYVELTAAGYVTLGDSAAIVTAAIRESLPQVLPTSEADALRLTSGKPSDGEGERGILEELREAGVPTSRGTLEAELKRWLTAGYIGRTGSGAKGSPYRFWLIATPPATFFLSKESGPLEESNEESGLRCNNAMWDDVEF